MTKRKASSASRKPWQLYLLTSQLLPCFKTPLWTVPQHPQPPTVSPADPPSLMPWKLPSHRSSHYLPNRKCGRRSQPGPYLLCVTPRILSQGPAGTSLVCVPVVFTAPTPRPPGSHERKGLILSGWSLDRSAPLPRPGCAGGPGSPSSPRLLVEMMFSVSAYHAS